MTTRTAAERHERRSSLRAVLFTKGTKPPAPRPTRGGK
jgi:hypothetical protein